VLSAPSVLHSGRRLAGDDRMGQDAFVEVVEGKPPARKPPKDGHFARLHKHLNEKLAANSHKYVGPHPHRKFIQEAQPGISPMFSALFVVLVVFACMAPCLRACLQYSSRWSVSESRVAYAPCKTSSQFT